MTKGNLIVSILCGQGGILSSVNTNDTLKEMFEPFFHALKATGREVINLGYIKTETQSIIDKDVIDPELYIKIVNGGWN